MHFHYDFRCCFTFLSRTPLSLSQEPGHWAVAGGEADGGSAPPPGGELEGDAVHRGEEGRGSPSALQR